MFIYYKELDLESGFALLKLPKADRLIGGRQITGASGKALFEDLYEKGQTIKCWKCGVEANCFIAVRHKNEKSAAPTLDLFAKTNNKLVMMTRDHIIPASLGGSNDVANLRPGCATCNGNRGIIMNEEDLQFMRDHPELMEAKNRAKIESLVKKAELQTPENVAAMAKTRAANKKKADAIRKAKRQKEMEDNRQAKVEAALNSLMLLVPRDERNEFVAPKIPESTLWQTLFQICRSLFTRPYSVKAAQTSLINSLAGPSLSLKS